MPYNLRKRIKYTCNSKSSPSNTEDSEESSSSDSEYIPYNKTTLLRLESIKKIKESIVYTKCEKKYLLNLNYIEQTKLLAMEKILEKTIENIPMRFKILLSLMSNDAKKLIMQKLENFNKMTSDSGEYFKLKQWLDNVIRIPFNIYYTFPIVKTDESSKIVSFMNKTKEILDNTVYGHIDAKQQILRIIAQWLSNPSSQGRCIGIHGAAGIGKTSLIKDGLSKALGMPFGFIALGGATDSSFLDGYSYTYEGSSYGKIIELLIQTKCNNPIIFFDELDKVSATKNGEEIIGVLTHLTDISQNDQFTDKYFSGIPINMSRSLLVFSYNDESLINPILKDRMITIEVKGYKKSEKLIIAKDYLLPNIYKTFGISDIVFNDNIIEKIIDIVSEEDGVRNLKRGLESIVSWINLYSYTGEIDIKYPFIVCEDFIIKHITKNTKDTEMVHRMYM